jgi:hypothetical protein
VCVRPRALSREGLGRRISQRGLVWGGGVEALLCLPTPAFALGGSSFPCGWTLGSPPSQCVHFGV